MSREFIHTYAHTRDICNHTGRLCAVITVKTGGRGYFPAISVLVAFSLESRKARRDRLISLGL